MSGNIVSSKSNESNDFVTWGHYNELYETVLTYLDEIKFLTTSGMQGDVEAKDNALSMIEDKTTAFRKNTDQLESLAESLIIPKEDTGGHSRKENPAQMDYYLESIETLKHRMEWINTTASQDMDTRGEKDAFIDAVRAVTKSDIGMLEMLIQDYKSDMGQPVKGGAA